jgi:hypothetical protein
MKFAPQAMLAVLGLGAWLVTPALAATNANGTIVAQATPAPSLAGTPEPTEEPTLAPDAALTQAAAVGTEWAAFAKIAESFTDVTAVLKNHETAPGKTFTSTLKISYKKPNYARCEITDGDGKGGAVVWRGGTKVKAHEGGEHSAIVVVLPRHSPRVTDYLGYGCGDTVPNQMVNYTEAHGKLVETAGPTVDGEATDLVTWTIAPGDFIKQTKEEFYISKTSHLPVMTKGYKGDVNNEETHYTWTLNPGLPFSLFDFS